MRRGSIALVIAVAGCILSSCRIKVLRGEGPEVTEPRTVAPFHAVVTDVPMTAHIQLQAGSQPGIAFKSYKNVLQHILTKVSNDTLHIYSDVLETWTIDNNDVNATITMPNINGLCVSGTCDADISGNATGSNLKIEVIGASDMNIENLNMDTFVVDIAGAADLTIMAGSVKSATYDIEGAGKLYAFPLQTQVTTATISGAGKGAVTASQKLTANIYGAGTIHYKGHPAVDQNVSGAGTITNAN